MAKSIDKSSKKSTSNTFTESESHSINLKPNNGKEIVNVIKDLNPNKAPGHDDIPTKLVKAAAHSLSPFLTSILIHIWRVVTIRMNLE